MITIAIAALVAAGLMLMVVERNRPEPRRVKVRISEPDRRTRR